MEGVIRHESDLNLKATELRLGLPGTDESTAKNNKRALTELVENCELLKGKSDAKAGDGETTPTSKAQIIGWPPVRSCRKNSVKPEKIEAETGNYVKVSMDGAPYLRKIDLKIYRGYQELLKALENMFRLTIGKYSEREGYKGSEYAPAYEDKDGDLMLVGDVPWDMFMSTCKKLRIMKGSSGATGLGCGA